MVMVQTCYVVMTGQHFEGESQVLDDGLNVGVSKREDSKVNLLVSNWVNAGLRKGERSQIPPTMWW